MAKKLPNETELFAELSSKQVVLSADMWNLIYSGVEDNLSIIHLLITFHLDNADEVPVNELRKIMTHVSDVFSVFRKLIHPQIIKTEDKGFVKIKAESQRLHPIIRDMFSHYIANDVQSINFIVGDHLDEKQPLDRTTAEKILGHIDDMKDFIAKLKENTETLEAKIRNHLTLPLVYLRKVYTSLDGDQRQKMEKCICSLEEIDQILVEKK